MFSKSSDINLCQKKTKIKYGLGAIKFLFIENLEFQNLLHSQKLIRYFLEAPHGKLKKIYNKKK